MSWKDNSIQTGYIRNPNSTCKWTLRDDKRKEKSRIQFIPYDNLTMIEI